MRHLFMRRLLLLLLAVMSGLVAGCAPTATDAVTRSPESPRQEESSASDACVASPPPSIPAEANLPLEAPQLGTALPALVCDWLKAIGQEDAMMAVAHGEDAYLIAGAGPEKSIHITRLALEPPSAAGRAPVLHVDYTLEDAPTSGRPTVLVLPGAAPGGQAPLVAPNPFMRTVLNPHRLPPPRRLRTGGISVVAPEPGARVPADTIKVQGFANTTGATLALAVRDQNGEVLGHVITEGGGSHVAFGSFVEIPIQYRPRSESGFVEGLSIHLGGGKDTVTHRVPVRFSVAEPARTLKESDRVLEGIRLGLSRDEAHALLGPPTSTDQTGSTLTWADRALMVELNPREQTVDAIRLRQGETPRGVRVGDPLARVEERYGPPHRRVEAERRLEYVSQLLDAALSFHWDAAGRVVEIRLTHGAGPWAPATVRIAPDAYDEPVTGTQPGNMPAAACPPLTEESAASLLVRLSRATPEERIALSAGKARTVFAEEAEWIAAGWPPWPQGVSMLPGWHQQAWFDLAVESTTGSEARLTLEHGDALVPARPALPSPAAQGGRSPTWNPPMACSPLPHPRFPVRRVN